MKALMDLRDMLCKELTDQTRKGELTAGSLETVHKLTDTIKNIDKIMMLEDSGYSGDGEWSARGNYSRGSYGNGMSNRGSYGNGGYGGSYGNESYDGGGYSGRRNSMGRYSRAEGNEMFRERIEDMLREGNMSAEEQNALQRAMKIISSR